jgi:hypothetical protein
MTRDPVFQAFLESAAADGREINAASRVLRVVPDPRRGRPSDTYHLLFDGLQHFRREPAGGVRVALDPIVVRVSFPDDFLRSADPGLAYRVIGLLTPVFHPNVSGHGLCISGFAAGIRLRGIAEQVFAVLSGRAFATNDALDPEAARFFAEHPERVQALARVPLWSTRAARASRVVALQDGEETR